MGMSGYDPMNDLPICDMNDDLAAVNAACDTMNDAPGMVPAGGDER
jgi:hypothetical protein